MHENRETSKAPAAKYCSRTVGEGHGRTTRMHAFEESDSGIIPMNHSNKDGKPYAENEEGRPLIKENTGQPNTYPTQSEKRVSQGLAGVHKAARKNKEMKFTALLHHVTVDRLQESFYALKRKAAPGVDGVTWQEYEPGLQESLIDLHSRVHRGTYRAKPSRRVYIEKADGRQRPLGIAALEDKIVQHAVVTVLNQIYEEDFLCFSYGFRLGRRQHDALDALCVGIMRKKVNWILDADIRSFFDEIRHDWLLKFVKHRIADRRILRLIGKWLRAGVSEEGQWSETERGTPQGSVASPLLANVYLPYAFDLWVQHWRQHRATGEVIVVRYADDAVLGFQHRADAEQFLRDWKERLGRFGLELHPDKTRLIEFGRYAVANRKERGAGKPETFDSLGFTHICGQTWKTGKFLVLRKTIRQRLSAKLRALKEELRRRRHLSVAELGKALRSVVQGYFNYHAVPGNLASLRSFRLQVIRRWMRALRRRSQKSRMTWPRLVAIAERWLPQPSILHPYPNLRFDAKHPR